MNQSIASFYILSYPYFGKGNPIMSKRTLLLIISALVALVLTTTGTLAYLSDTDADVNVMTLGNVYITQNEQQRDENGNLEAFENNKPAYPAVGPVTWDDELVKIGDTGYKVFTDDLKNVIDKFVTVTNTGKSDAYVRTIVAIEAPGFDPNDLIHINHNSTGVNMSAPITVKIDAVDYVAFVFTYPEALAADETSVPSLMQLFLDSKATNEDVAKFGDTWEVLVLSQAVQTAGFKDAEAALNTAFGVANATNLATWMSKTGEGSQMVIGTPGDKNDTNNPPLISDAWDGTTSTAWYSDSATTFTLATAEDLAGLAELVNGGNSFSGKTVKLDSNVDLQNIEWTPIGSSANAFEGTFDGQGNTISNLFINNEGGSEQALFGCAASAKITGVTVKNVNINAYSESAAISAYNIGTTISDCHVSGTINIVTEWAYVGGIAAHGYMSIEDCSVVATGTGVIKSETRNAAGGICGWLWEDGHHITNCEVANLEITAWANVGGVTGFIHRNNQMDGCSVDNVVLTKTRAGGNPTIGLAAGGYSYNATRPITLSNNTFTNITINGESKEFAAYNILYGAEYDGTVNANFILTNNTQTGITDNTTIYIP